MHMHKLLYKPKIVVMETTYALVVVHSYAKLAGNVWMSYRAYIVTASYNMDSMNVHIIDYIIII